MAQERNLIHARNRCLLWGGVVLALMLMAGCRGDATPGPARAMPTSIPVPTPLPPLPTLPPPGSADNPLVILLVTPEAASLQDGAQALSSQLSDEAGLSLVLRLTDAYAEARRALCDRAVVAVSLDAFSYLAASRDGCGTAAYVLEREGAVATRGQFLARDAFLPQSYRGVFCRPDGQSLNGWVMPTLTLRARGVDTFTDMYSIVDAGSDEEVVRLIEAGQCGLGATTAGAHEEVRGLAFPERLLVLEELAPVPNEALVFSSALDEPMRALVQDLAAAHLDDLAALLGGEALRPVDDSAFSDLRDLLAGAGVDPSDLSQ